ncbi:hypothetical protein WOLCODRAFT_137483 [Wolfiporia cocos MD-104 SS10]|uniref:Manganese and iron superoxide dismutase n=1 Tax=Wolfiporia cocos (strain MD-104) TaxID=742152 RepID=A0A2H3JZJ9_WOLCO|nr:hypothetical protein WOLCODRAFT_137483 [Wolfiporia cocos MD-104 SS10]
MASLGLRFAAGSSRAARIVPAWAHAGQMRTRNLHYRQELKYPVEEGLGQFLSPEGLKMLAVEYQQGLLDRLNEEVKGTSLADKSVVQTVIESARDPHKSLAFRYSCEALNNSFFLDSLRPPPPDASSHEDGLRGTSLFNRIRTQYGTLQEIKSSLSAAVLGVSSAWIWLVCDQTGALAIWPSFGPGTLLVRSRTKLLRNASDRVLGEQEPGAPSSSQSAPSDSAPTSPASGLSHPPSPPPSFTGSQTRSYTTSPNASQYVPNMYEGEVRRPITPSGTEDPTRAGEILYPLFCVSAHERAWIGGGYGVWGQEEYMKRFWTVVDWKTVADTYNKWIMDRRNAGI